MPHIDPFQFGSVKKSSTTHALVHLVHQLLLATETPKTLVRSCLIDFSKAFDRIDHNILLQKLLLLNVPPILLNWCADFLRLRQQRVKVNQFTSTWLRINAGVPQGTKLGPLFFLVMVNDLSSSLPLYKYVDDCSTYEIISTTAVVPSALQREIDNISRWSTTNNMRLNVTKTKELTVSFLKNPPVLPPLTINQVPLESVQSFKLLGVMLSSDLKWETHTNYICSKASSRLYALRTLKRSGVPAADLCSVFCYFVRPILEYACPVWHFSLTVLQKDNVEHIQRRAVRIIYPHLSYKHGLRELNLPTLFERRESICRSFYERSLSPDCKLSDLIPRPVPHRYHFRDARKIPLIKCRTNRFQNSFLPSCVRLWDNCK